MMNLNGKQIIAIIGAVVSVLMVTIGLGAFLHGMVDAIWGGQNLEMPQMLPRKPLIWGDIMLPGAVFWSFWVALAVIAGLSLYFRYSRTGIAMRAAASASAGSGLCTSTIRCRRG